MLRRSVSQSCVPPTRRRSYHRRHHTSYIRSRVDVASVSQSVLRSARSGSILPSASHRRRRHRHRPVWSIMGVTAHERAETVLPFPGDLTVATPPQKERGDDESAFRGARRAEDGRRDRRKTEDDGRRKAGDRRRKADGFLRHHTNTTVTSSGGDVMRGVSC